MMTFDRLWRLSLLLVLVLAAPAAALHAQTPEQVRRQIQSSSPDEIRRQIQASGLTNDEIRARLAAAGYDPGLLDEYLAGAVPTASQGELTPEMMAALRALGPEPSAMQGIEPFATPVPAGTAASQQPLPPDSLPLFGADVFSRGTSQFQPLLAGPVPPGYRLGAGDVLVLVITGDVEFVHTLEITREGYVVIPQVGQVFANNLTMAQLEDVLRRRLGAVYSGLRTGTTDFDVSVARVRTNQVYVIGEVAQPGAYQLSALATALNALYAAGGPTERGNFRQIEIRRGGALVAVLDLYDYLLRGETAGDVSLQQGDIVRVPIHGTRASVAGAVVRPAIYELLPGETLRDLIDAAGGFRADAALDRITIRRIVPLGQRLEGQPARTVIDVPIRLAATEDIAIMPGDEVRVHALTAASGGFITLQGNVYFPGTYGWEPGMRLSDLIAAAGGFRPATYSGTAHIERLSLPDSTRFLLRVPLPDSGQAFADDRPLAQYDVVTIYGETELRADRTVRIAGWVNDPGEYQFRPGMTLRDLVLQASGLRDGALLEFVEVARLPEQREPGEMADVMRVPLDSSYVFTAESPGYPLVPADAGVSGPAATFTLEPFDHVLVLRQPEFELQRVVHLGGEVNLPGSYALRTREERISDVVARAGGLSTTAFAEGARLVRAQGGFGVVDIELDEALRRPGSSNDLVLLPGDSIFVPEYNPVVRVVGAVTSPTSVRYRSGADLDFYINAAGGLAHDADEGRVSVRYANGSIRSVRKFLFVSSKPEPEPGSTVQVPFEDPDGGIDATQLFTNIAQIAAALATVVIVLTRTN